ncbi:MAG: cobalamin-dependent protein [Gaiellales bacterium]
MSTLDPTLLTLQEAADAVGCHYQTLYKRVRSGELPALVAGGSYRISRDDLDAWLRERDAAKGAVPERAERDWPRQVETLVASLITGDARAARKQLDRLTAGGVTVDELCDRLLAPTLARIGDLWHGNDLSIADEHRASRIVETLLDRATAARPKTGPRIGSAVVATAIGDRHSIAAQMVAAGLQAEGFSVHYLGADLPVEEIVNMAKREQADLVALSCCVAERGGLSAAIAALNAAGFPVMVGGNGIGRDEALALGAARYGGSICQAQELARELVRTGA